MSVTSNDHSPLSLRDKFELSESNTGRCAVIFMQNNNLLLTFSFIFPPAFSATLAFYRSIHIIYGASYSSGQDAGLAIWQAGFDFPGHLMANQSK